MIIDELKNVNLKYEWDGNANACIIVHNERRFTADSDGQFKLPI